MTKFLTTIFVLVNACLVMAQKEPATISGTLKDATSQAPIEYATVTVYSSADSSLVAGALTDSLGAFTIRTEFGSFYLKAEFIGYEPVFLGGIELSKDKSEFNTGDLMAGVSAELIDEVVVTAEKNRIQNSIDKKVFNVEKDISNIGGTAQDALQNIPSVDVDSDGTISLRGSSNVRILINGKPSGLTGISSNAALAQIPANMIESIEVITNPSVKYDSEGMAGIINIILKKNAKKGLNGLVSLTAGYPWNNTGTVNIDYGTKRVNLNASYSLQQKAGPGINNAHRETTVNDTTSYIDQNGDFSHNSITNLGKIGADFLLNDRNTLSASVSLRNSAGHNLNTTEYRYSDFNDDLTNIRLRNSDQTNNSLNTDYSLDYRKKFKKEGRLFSMNAQFSNSYEKNSETISQQSYDAAYVPDSSPELQQRSNSNEGQRTLLIQTDYTHPIKNAKLETGLKSTIQQIDKIYSLEQYDDTTASWIPWTGMVSNRFLYNQGIYAGYMMLGGKIKKLEYQVGIRAEQTIVTSKLIETNEKHNYNYLNFFPSGHFGIPVKGNNLIKLSYSRRIKRPSYYTLNPFWSFSDPLNFWVGNPTLQPEYTHSFELGETKYWKKSNLSGTVYYRYTSNVIQRIKVLDSTGIAITKPYNMNNMNSFGLELAYSANVGKWWRLNTSFNFFRNIIDGRNVGPEYSTDFYSWTGKLSSTINFGKGWSAMQMFNYRAPKGSTQGTRHQMYFLDLALTKEFLKGKGSLSFKVSDVFNSKKYINDIYGDGYYIQSTFQFIKRTFLLSFNYTINNYKQRRGGDHTPDVEMF